MRANWAAFLHFRSNNSKGARYAVRFHDLAHDLFTNLVEFATGSNARLDPAELLAARGVGATDLREVYRRHEMRRFGMLPPISKR